MRDFGKQMEMVLFILMKGMCQLMPILKMKASG